MEAHHAGIEVPKSRVLAAPMRRSKIRMALIGLIFGSVIAWPLGPLSGHVMLI